MTLKNKVIFSLENGTKKNYKHYDNKKLEDFINNQKSYVGYFNGFKETTKIINIKHFNKLEFFTLLESKDQASFLYCNGNSFELWEYSNLENTYTLKAISDNYKIMVIEKEDLNFYNCTILDETYNTYTILIIYI